MKVLELFSGTQSVSKVCEEKGYEVVSVDINDYKGQYIPTHKVDIMNFDYKKYKKNDFDIIWASPPCISYSNLQYTWLGRYRINKKTGKKYIFTMEHLEKDMKEADKLVKRTLKIIKYFKPRLWFIENPKTGRLCKRDMMTNIPYYNVDYCMYCNWGYKKSTTIWTNKKDFKPLTCNKKCGNIDKDGIHKVLIGGFYKNIRKTKFEKYKIPEKLIESLLE